MKKSKEINLFNHLAIDRRAIQNWKRGIIFMRANVSVFSITCLYFGNLSLVHLFSKEIQSRGRGKASCHS
jgi:hypothetical protein